MESFKSNREIPKHTGIKGLTQTETVIQENVESVFRRIREACSRSGRDPKTVRVVAASKTVGPERIEEAIRAGISIIGENRVQEAREKKERVREKAEWHMIGRLQKNKVKFVFDLFEMVQSLDSLELARAIDQRGKKENRILKALVEVNTGMEESKSGLPPGTVLETIKSMARLQNVRILGLMTVPPYSDNPEDSRKYFRELQDLRRQILSAGIEGVEMEKMSYGMTNDFEVAVEEGATMVRIGRAIFGERLDSAHHSEPVEGRNEDLVQE